LRWSEPAILSDVVFPEDTDLCGTMFGGHALAVMDKAAFLAANRFAYTLAATASSESVDFTGPIRAGMILEAVAQVIRVGRTSIVVRVILTCREPLSTEERQATVGYFTMVRSMQAARRSTRRNSWLKPAEWEHLDTVSRGPCGPAKKMSRVVRRRSAPALRAMARGPFFNLKRNPMLTP
jgi:acyl-CoA hydrolase